MNGTLRGSGGSTLSIPALASQFRLASASSGGNFLSATIDEVAVYGRALTAADVAAHSAGRSGGCSDISGATASKYVVTSADVGATLRLAVTASNAAGSTTAYSAPTARVTP